MIGGIYDEMAIYFMRRLTIFGWLFFKGMLLVFLGLLWAVCVEWKV